MTNRDEFWDDPANGGDYPIIGIARHKQGMGFNGEQGKMWNVEQAKRLLIATRLTIPVIAERSGFANAKKLAETFRRETGLTATDYRRRYEIRPAALKNR